MGEVVGLRRYPVKSMLGEWVPAAEVTERGLPGDRLRVICPTLRCAVPTLAHGTLPRDGDALRIPARHNRVPPVPDVPTEPCVGAYAEVLAPGRVRRGDPARF